MEILAQHAEQLQLDAAKAWENFLGELSKKFVHEIRWMFASIITTKCYRCERETIDRCNIYITTQLKDSFFLMKSKYLDKVMHSRCYICYIYLHIYLCLLSFTVCLFSISAHIFVCVCVFI